MASVAGTPFWQVDELSRRKSGIGSLRRPIRGEGSAEILNAFPEPLTCAAKKGPRLPPHVRGGGLRSLSSLSLGHLARRTFDHRPAVEQPLEPLVVIDNGDKVIGVSEHCPPL